MLSRLTITNFAIIDKLEIDFKDGLIVLTGETGAGKSILVDALDFLLGSRGSTDLIKTGSNKAQVEGTFTIRATHELPLLEWLEKNGFDISENNIITISREVSSQGSKARINGSLANVSHLSYLREFLLDIHQQSEHIELLANEKQLEILDSYGDKIHKKTIQDYKKCFEDYKLLKSKLDYHLEHSEDIKKQIDFLEFEATEIKNAKINNFNEDNELLSKREILLNKKELMENTSLAHELISGENQNSLFYNLTQIKKLITKSSEYDRSFEPYLEIIENSIQEIKDLSSFLKSYQENIEQDEDYLEEIEERLDLLYRIKKKYGKSLAEVQENLKKIQSKLNELKCSSTSYKELEEMSKQKTNALNDLAHRLTSSREKITKSFIDKINDELKTLGFKEVLLVADLTECELYSNGKEQIQFLFSANPDEPPKPLLKVASGGELSRIMLAIKSIISSPMQQKTMILDEIDIGVSGEIASSVAKKLYKISRYNQVICITHQPIIAAMSDQHFLIEKFTKEGTTQVIVKEVSQNEKSDALVSLLTPDKKAKEGIVGDAKQFAESLLQNAKKIKEKELIETK